MVIQRLLVLVVVASLAACSSTRLLADPQRGFAGDGPRQVSLAFDRMSVGEPAGEDDGPWVVTLPLHVANGTNAVWVLHARDFEFREVAAADVEAAFQVAPAGGALAEIPPRSTASLDLPIALPLGDAGDRRPLAGRRFRLRCRASDADGTTRLVLERELVFDEFSPVRQGAYAGLLGVLTLGLFLVL